ncbi:MAG TPA: hypothetical protein DHV62_10345 [Elusimicrobia bacterium]|nr:hypothetical protein [Elusimicrobiota bacterium]
MKNEKLEDVVRRTETLVGREKSFDMVKVFFGAQPGDSIICNAENKEELTSLLKKIASENGNFGFEYKGFDYELWKRQGLGVYVFYNQEAVKEAEKKNSLKGLLSTYLREYMKIQDDKFDKKTRDRILGIFYGFPSCCIKKCPEELRHTPPEDDGLNKYTEHDWCSKDCKKSKQLNDKYENIYKQFYRN